MQALSFNQYEIGSVRSLSAEEIALIGGADGWSAMGTALGGMSASFAIVAGVVSLIPGGQPAGLFTGAIAGVAGAGSWICNEMSSD